MTRFCCFKNHQSLRHCSRAKLGSSARAGHPWSQGEDLGAARPFAALRGVYADVRTQAPQHHLNHLLQVTSQDYSSRLWRAGEPAAGAEPPPSKRVRVVEASGGHSMTRFRGCWQHPRESGCKKGFGHLGCVKWGFLSGSHQVPVAKGFRGHSSCITALARPMQDQELALLTGRKRAPGLRD